MKTLFIVLILIALWIARWWYVTKKFQKNMRIGDKCAFYIGTDKYTGRITYVGDIVHIKYIHGVILKERSTVYPNKFWL